MNVSTDSLLQVGQSSANWIPLVLQFYKDVRTWLRRSLHGGVYEILEYESILELLDAKGERAVFKKRLRVKFLQDNVIAFQDYAWGDGQALLNYRCSPGVIVDRYREGTRWNVLISLRETKATGDIEEFHIERRLRGSFAASEAWWETSLQHRASQVKVCIIFPKERPCRKAVLVERNRNRTTLLGPDRIESLPDGRQILTWETDKAKRFETYTLKWHW